MSKKKIRPLGQVTTDMEKLILEMTDTHDLQWGEVLNLIHGYLQVHCPESQEAYNEGGHPIFFYGYPPKK